MCDARNTGIGVLLEIRGVEVENMAWLWKVDDYDHINVTEFDAVLKGVNLAMKWGLYSIKIRMDLTTILG